MWTGKQCILTVLLLLLLALLTVKLCAWSWQGTLWSGVADSQGSAKCWLTPFAKLVLDGLDAKSALNFAPTCCTCAAGFAEHCLSVAKKCAKKLMPTVSCLATEDDHKCTKLWQYIWSGRADQHCAKCMHCQLYQEPWMSYGQLPGRHGQPVSITVCRNSSSLTCWSTTQRCAGLLLSAAIDSCNCHVSGCKTTSRGLLQKHSRSAQAVISRLCIWSFTSLAKVLQSSCVKSCSLTSSQIAMWLSVSMAAGGQIYTPTSPPKLWSDHNNRMMRTLWLSLGHGLKVKSSLGLLLVISAAFRTPLVGPRTSCHSLGEAPCNM